MSARTDGRTLIACIGNIFLGDDGFGCAVARELTAMIIPPDTTVVDYGIRGLDLAYALLEPYQAVIFVDATARGSEPGTVYLLQPGGANQTEPAPFDAHSMDPDHLLAMARSLGEICAEIYIVGCEPKDFGDELEGSMGLSDVVAAAVPLAARTALDVAIRIGQQRSGRSNYVLQKQ